MKKNNKFLLWNSIAKLILKNRIIFIITVLFLTVFFAFQWEKLYYSFKESNLLPTQHILNKKKKEFIKKFGAEDNIIIIGIKDSTLFNTEKINIWNRLNEEIENYKEIDFVISTNNIKILEKDTLNKKIIVVPLDKKGKDPLAIKKVLFEKLPFFEGVLYNKKSKAIRSIIYLDKDVVNSGNRKGFIIKKFIPLLKKYEEKIGIKIYISGESYMRPLNGIKISRTIFFLITITILVTSFIFYLFFRSFRATFISMLVVAIASIWSLGILGLVGYGITILLALVPPLIVVISIPNCVYFINKYQNEIISNGNKKKSLQTVIKKIGNITLITNITTAVCFATFIFTNNTFLKEFGIIASLSIITVFFVSLITIPIIYSYIPLPKKRHLVHLKRKNNFFLINYIKYIIFNKRKILYLIAFLFFIISLFGISKIKFSETILDTFPKKVTYYQDILFFDEEFSGIHSLEFWIDTKKKGKATGVANLKKVEELEKVIQDIPELSKPTSIANIIKFAKQAYYNGNPKYYQLPTIQENAFIGSYLTSVESDSESYLSNYLDTEKQHFRVTTFIKNISVKEIENIKNKLEREVKRIFNPDKYTVELLGKPIFFLKETKYLVQNLFLSLTIAIFLISLIVILLFRSFKIVLIFLIPNILPLIITGGIIGFLGITIKPSIILIFSISFGISVDDAMHFLGKYKQEIIKNKNKIKKAIITTLKETSISMFYTSIILFFGFAVFLFSDFESVASLGLLIALTLIVAMVSNLLLLPSLIISLKKDKKKKMMLYDKIYLKIVQIILIF